MSATSTLERMDQARAAAGAALLASALDPESAAVLVEMFVPSMKGAALDELSVVGNLPSAERQALVASRFGEVADGPARLMRLCAECPDSLREAVLQAAPVYLRPAAMGAPRGPNCAPLGQLLAGRLVQEATR